MSTLPLFNDRRSAVVSQRRAPQPSAARRTSRNHACTCFCEHDGGPNRRSWKRASRAAIRSVCCGSRVAVSPLWSSAGTRLYVRAYAQSAHALVAHNAQLTRIDPRHMLAARRQRLSQLQSLLQAPGHALSHPPREQLARFARRLMALSPLASLARGYAIVLHEPSGWALSRASDAQLGDGLQIRLHEGTLRARVETS